MPTRGSGPEQFDFTGTRRGSSTSARPGVHERMDAPSPDGNGFAEVLARARAAGLRTNLELVCVEPERIRALATPCLPHLDTIIINELEAAAITGRGRIPRRAAARQLVRLGVRDLAVVHFPGRAASPPPPTGAIWRQAAVRVPPGEIRSSNGAGDAFAAGRHAGAARGHAGRALPRAGRVRGRGEPALAEPVGRHPCRWPSAWPMASARDSRPQ